MLRDREIEKYLSLPLPLKEEFSLYQQLWDLLDYGEKVDKSDTFQPLNGLRSNPQIGLEKLVFLILYVN